MEGGPGVAEEAAAAFARGRGHWGARHGAKGDRVGGCAFFAGTSDSEPTQRVWAAGWFWIDPNLFQLCLIS